MGSGAYSTVLIDDVDYYWSPVYSGDARGCEMDGWMQLAGNISDQHMHGWRGIISTVFIWVSCACIHACWVGFRCHVQAFLNYCTLAWRRANDAFIYL
jgi:hypothetical protein